MDHLISKYNTPVPRYTSYPPANFFHDNFAESQLWEAITHSNTQEPNHLSFYIHIPFCKRLCYYCGCNSFPMQQEQEVREYRDAIKREINLVCEKISPGRKISQIHFGGGSPTAIPLSYIKEINSLLLQKFECIDNPEIAIECHPGYMDEHDFELLVDAGFNRISIGIQDFNNAVLKACNRKAPQVPIDRIVTTLRNRNIHINFDFIYGLPLQTTESFTETIQQAIALSPDRLVTFSYAHVPHIFPRQQLLERNPLPQDELKNNIYENAQKLLLHAGYIQVGIDHFVKQNDELSIARQNHTLHRNFQGYCTRRTTGQVYAFGATAISQLTSAYTQNTKSINEYIETINKGHIPVKKGYVLSQEEQILREVITDLMCNNRINWQEIADRVKLSVAEVKSATTYDEKKLQEFADDGITEWSEQEIRMKQKGSPFVRNVAASLDKLLLQSDKTFSKPI